MSNADNPRNGAVFQKQVLTWFQEHYKADFEIEKKLPIGSPAKDHKFDIVNINRRIAIECKRYTWTETGNVPSAKMGFTNEAAFYLSFLPDSYEKYIVMMYSRHEKRQETLAEYYNRTYKHLLGKIIVAEFNTEEKQLRIIGETSENEKGNGFKKNSLESLIFAEADVNQAVLLLQGRKSDIARYCDIQQRSSEVNIAEDKAFQKKFTAFYRLRRNAAWRGYYFRLLEDQKNRKEKPSFAEIQLRLFQKCGQIESSFSSKMLATIDPDMPIWDSYVLKNLGFKLKGKNKEERLSLAVTLYDNICSWYRDYLKSGLIKHFLSTVTFQRLRKLILLFGR